MSLRRLSKIAIAARPAAEPEPAAPAGLGGQGGCRGGAGVLRPQKVRWPRRMKSVRDIRVIPVVLVAIFGLAVLKIAGLVIDGGYVFDYQPQSTKQSWAQETFNFPGGQQDPITADITGSVEKPKEEREDKARKQPSPPVAAPEVTKPEGTVVISRAGPAGVAVRARHPRAAAIAAAGTRSARARNRHSRKPAQGRRKASRIARSRS